MTVIGHVGLYDDDDSIEPSKVAKVFEMILSEMLMPESPTYQKIQCMNDDGKVYYCHDFTFVTTQSQSIVESLFGCDYYEGWWDYLSFEGSCERYESDGKITNHGNSLVVNLTEGCRRLGIGKGDYIHIMVRKI